MFRSSRIDFWRQVKKGKQDGELKMTHEEAKRIEDCIQKPEFVDLFRDYVTDISDPKNMEEYDAYIRQLEEQGEIPENEEIIRPEPGFCVKAKSVDVGSKIFINCAGTDRVPAPTLNRGQTRTDSCGKAMTGGCWSIPYIYTSFRMDRDKSDTPCQVFDILFNSNTIEMSATTPQFKALVVQTALESLEENAKIKLKNVQTNKYDYTILKNCRYKGSVVKPHKLKKDPAASTPKPKVASASSSKSTNSNPPPSVEKKEAGPTKPKISFIHRGEFDLSECIPSSGSATLPISRRPKELVVKLELPLMASVADMKLEIRQGVLEFDVPGIYSVRERLPYPVEEDSGDAKYNKTQKLLTVTLAVKRWSPEEIAQEVKEAEARRAAEEEARARQVAEAEERRRRDEQCAVRRGFLSGGTKKKQEDPVDGGRSGEADAIVTLPGGRDAESNKSTLPLPKDPLTAVPEKLATSGIPSEGAVSSDEMPGPKAAADAPHGEAAPLEEGLVSFRQNDRNVTVVVRVEAIDPSSVSIDYGRSAVLLGFTACGADGGRRYRHELRLAGEIEPAACRHDTSKSNLVGCYV